jgi:plasmid stabilization system protein ParE
MRDDLFLGARLYAVGSHYLLYFVLDRTVIVARILDQRMDLVRHLGDLGE